MNAVTIWRTEQGWYLKLEVLDSQDLIVEVRHLQYGNFIDLIKGLAKIYCIDLKKLIAKTECNKTVKFLKLIK